MLLVGAEFGRDESINKHNMKSKYRILPKQFGQYDGKTILEIEKVCIGTNSTSEEEYLKCEIGFLTSFITAYFFKYL